jgi:hypothetical protein
MMPDGWVWDAKAAVYTIKPWDPMDHVESYLDMLACFLVGAGIEVHAPRSQVAGPEVPEHRLVQAVVNPDTLEANDVVIENAFPRFSWQEKVRGKAFLYGTSFLMTDRTFRGTQTWSVCDQPIVFMAPAALGLDTEKETWWGVSTGCWCPVLCCVCERCSQWWWWWWWQCNGGGGSGGGGDGAGDLVVQRGNDVNVVVVVLGTVPAMAVQQRPAIPDV